MRHGITVLVLIALIICSGGSVSADMIVNEVMANEPGAFVSLEWIEIYNNSSGVELLSDYTLEILDGNTSNINELYFSDTLTFQPYEYLIICRNLISDGTTQGFEGVWGDSSLIWGDTYFESAIPKPIEMTFSLNNASGSVRLVGLQGVVSELSWDRSGADGVSWERVSFTSNIIDQSIDPKGATPGTLNSLTPVDEDLALELDNIHTNNGETVISFAIYNVGNNSVSGKQLQIKERTQSGSHDLETIDIPTIISSATYTFERRYILDGYYTTLECVLSEDDRLSNNVVKTQVPGSKYPPLSLSEFLANPTSELKTEWIELANRSDTVVDLHDWQFGDALVLYHVTDDTFLLYPDEFIVLADDTTEFLSFYSSFDGLLLQPSQWATLNNDVDVVRLVDLYGFVADSLYYDRLFPQNSTWGKGEDSNHENKWGISEIPGGTPGEPNRVFFEPNSPYMSLDIYPNIISPDGDGIDDFATITVGAPGGNEYELKIYDKQGRTVYTFDRVSDENIWMGLSSSGSRLPVGIYLVYFEVTGGESVKKPIVIAR